MCVLRARTDFYRLFVFEIQTLDYDEATLYIKGFNCSKK